MKQAIAATPPMGWNSWDCYGASVTESEVKGNADYMAAHLKSHGWDTVVVDIQWYEPTANSSAYHAFAPLDMDQYGRLVPAVNRFPSAAGSRSFRPLADYVHGLGLKFGIHIMRGIPRQAVHANTPILGATVRAAEIAHRNSICDWNTDMYGVDASKPGAQAWYDSLFQMYAEWNVDYVKVDDIARSYSQGEIEQIRQAIDTCGREMALSLSPGPAPLAQAEHLKANANLWRLSDDFWDRWQDLYRAFDLCHAWEAHSGPGHWPDADMLPLGHIGIRSCEHGMGDRWTRFTQAEQVTLMTLWCMARSPLMFGGELRDNDAWTLSLLTNDEVLAILKTSHSNRQLYRRGGRVAWTAAAADGGYYLAHFNLRDEPDMIETGLSELDMAGRFELRDLWERRDCGIVERRITTEIPGHGARLFKLAAV
jgi:alpha-galactosidase